MIQECLIEITKLAFDDKPKNPSAVNLISGLLAPESEKIREALKAAGIPLGDGNAGADRSVEHLIFGQDPISTGEHHEMLLFIAVKMHWRAATGSIAYAPFVSVLESRTAIGFTGSKMPRCIQMRPVLSAANATARTTIPAIGTKSSFSKIFYVS